MLGPTDHRYDKSRGQSAFKCGPRCASNNGTVWRVAIATSLLHYACDTPSRSVDICQLAVDSVQGGLLSWIVSLVELFLSDISPKHCLGCFHRENLSANFTSYSSSINLRPFVQVANWLQVRSRMTVISFGKCGAPGAIRTPDLQIRSLVHAFLPQATSSCTSLHFVL